MNYLIVNADDLGLTPGVSEGILKSMLDGIVTRTSAMVCTESRDLLPDWMAEIPGRVGMHLQLTDGIPLTPTNRIPTLVGPDGRFPKNKEYWLNPDPEEVRIEWENQIRWLLDCGVTPSHLDSHHNVHRFPPIQRIYVELAKKYRLPTRPLNDNMRNRFLNLGAIPGGMYCDTWEGMNVTAKSLIIHILGGFRRCTDQESLEFVCHPGYVDEPLCRRSHYLQAREQELKALCDPSVKHFLAERNICLTAGQVDFYN
ncbi:MAG TPA: ChbG/HpnK family deacetylase [Flavilitoribacter sp.]|nr:ChbG/HpnK family deacetylase [Flavilitoribacter sp.]HMQ87369.1 ChbG/HpnK family deacetylase [Flavilitoribacter sp.]